MTWVALAASPRSCWPTRPGRYWVFRRRLSPRRHPRGHRPAAPQARGPAVKPLDPRLLRHVRAGPRLRGARRRGGRGHGRPGRRPGRPARAASSPGPSSTARRSPPSPPLLVGLARRGRRPRRCWPGPAEAAAHRASARRHRAAARRPASTTPCGWDRAIPACPRPGSSAPSPPAGWTRSTATSAATCPRCCSPRRARCWSGSAADRRLARRR